MTVTLPPDFTKLVAASAVGGFCGGIAQQLFLPTSISWAFAFGFAGGTLGLWIVATNQSPPPAFVREGAMSLILTELAMCTYSSLPVAFLALVLLR